MFTSALLKFCGEYSVTCCNTSTPALCNYTKTRILASLMQTVLFVFLLWAVVIFSPLPSPHFFSVLDLPTLSSIHSTSFLPYHYSSVLSSVLTSRPSTVVSHFPLAIHFAWLFIYKLQILPSLLLHMRIQQPISVLSSSLTFYLNEIF